MTDAERIAEYIRVDIATVERALREPYKSNHGAIKQFAAMLSDVRREEREACVEIAMNMADANEQSDLFVAAKSPCFYWCRKVELALRARGSK